MLNVLQEVEKELLALLDKTDWNSVNIDYETPHVERLWIPYGDYRVSLHRIHQCEKSLMHPHPWPQAVRVISGCYEMGVGPKAMIGLIHHLSPRKSSLTP